MEQKTMLWMNPFERVAGLKSLLWGTLGVLISIIIAYYSKFHYHGLLHFGPAPNNALWCFAAEHVIVWLIPALLFWLGGLILSKSRIRVIDVFGTTLFAQLPFIAMNLFYLLPPMQRLNNVDYNVPPLELLQQPEFMQGVWFSLISLIFLVWMFIWMFYALKVSCNLKGARLIILYCIGIFGGDVLCRLIINQFY